MPSESDLLNDALGQIGAAKITAIDDGSINANHCLTFYPSLRDSLLRSHKWNFAMKRVQLALDLTGPVYEFTYAYTLPADCLKVEEYAGGTPTFPVLITDTIVMRPQYRIEGRKLYTNDGQAWVLYLRQVTNPDEFDALFYQVLATWLASKLATAIQHDPKMAQGLMVQAVQVLLPIATAADGQEGTIDPFMVRDLLWGRNLV